MQVPQSWDCHFKNNIWKCLDKQSPSKNKISMSLAAQLKKNYESLSYFERSFKKTKRYKSFSKLIQKSIPQSLKRKNINGQTWIEAFHFAGEAPQYYTHYLATVSGGISILLSYSYHRGELKSASKTYYKLINSIKIKTHNSSAEKINPMAAVSPHSKTRQLKQVFGFSFSDTSFYALVALLGLIILAFVAILLKKKQ